jgi:hypothetical protein
MSRCYIFRHLAYVCGRWRNRTACSPKLFGEQSPLWSDAVAIISAMCEAINHPLIPILPVCANYSGFYLPNMSILIVLFFVLETSEPHGGLGMNK